MPLGLTRGKAVIVDYDPRWPALFEEERARISSAIGHMVAGVHHVGSTSIPGMAAKPILDIAVMLREFQDGERCIGPLESIGYTHRGLNPDIPGDRFFVKGHPPREGGSRGEVRTHFLHMYPLDSPLAQNHLAFRDYLIAQPKLAAEYMQLKFTLADRHPDDRVSYGKGKATFIRAVLARAAGDLQ